MAARVLSKVIITRIKDTVESRTGRVLERKRTIEQIVILRNIFEQGIEWEAHLYACFVDFEKAFDSIVSWRCFVGNNGRVWCSINIV